MILVDTSVLIGYLNRRKGQLYNDFTNMGKIIKELKIHT